MSAINAINLSRFFLKFIPQDPDPWTQKNADPADPGSGSFGINLRENLLKYIAFIADILLTRANL